MNTVFKILLFALSTSLTCFALNNEEQKHYDELYRFAENLSEATSSTAAQEFQGAKEIMDFGQNLGALYREGLELSSKTKLSQEERMKRHREISQHIIAQAKELQAVSNLKTVEDVTSFQTGYYSGTLNLDEKQTKELKAILFAAHDTFEKRKLNREEMPRDPNEIRDWYKERRVLRFTTNERVMSLLSPDQLHFAQRLPNGVDILNINFSSGY